MNKMKTTISKFGCALAVLAILPLTASATDSSLSGLQGGANAAHSQYNADIATAAAATQQYNAAVGQYYSSWQEDRDEDGNVTGGRYTGQWPSSAAMDAANSRRDASHAAALAATAAFEASARADAAAANVGVASEDGGVPAASYVRNSSISYEGNDNDDGGGGSGSLWEWSEVGGQQIGPGFGKLTPQTTATQAGTVTYAEHAAKSQSNATGNTFTLRDVALTGKGIFTGHAGNEVSIDYGQGSKSLSKLVKPETKTGQLWKAALMVEIGFGNLGVLNWYWVYEWYHVKIREPKSGNSFLIAHTSRRIAIWKFGKGEKPSGNLRDPDEKIDAPSGSAWPENIKVSIKGYYYAKLPKGSRFSIKGGKKPNFKSLPNSKNFASLVTVSATTAYDNGVYYPWGTMTMRPGRFSQTDFRGGAQYPTSPAVISWDATKRR